MVNTSLPFAGTGGVAMLIVVDASAVNATIGDPSATVTVPRVVSSASRNSIVTDASSYATTVEMTDAGNAADTSELGPVMIVSAPVCTTGTPKANPVSVRLNDSGRGNTGSGASPNTRPENQRFVGGMSPSASRLAGIGATDS